MTPMHTTTISAVLLAICVYPFIANNLLNQRKNAAAVISVLMMGFVIFPESSLIHLPASGWASSFWHLTSFGLFAYAFINRRRNQPNPFYRMAPWLALGGLASFGFGVISHTYLLACLAVMQLCSLVGLTRMYNNLAPILHIKGITFAVGYASLGLAIVINPPEIKALLYWAMLFYTASHFIFQDFSRARLRIKNTQHRRLNTDLIHLSFKGRRVLKDFRHDLRQPISTMGILASVGKAISKDPEVSARYQHIQTAQKALKTMLEDFFEKLEGTFDSPISQQDQVTTRFTLDHVLQPLIDEYRPLAKTKHLELRYQPTKVELNTCKEALSKILRNGLDNAIKYTSRGGVILAVRRKQGRMCIQIIDTGPGIDSDKILPQNKGWGHGSSMIQDLSASIGADTECRNRLAQGEVRGSLFQVCLPEEASTDHFKQAVSNNHKQLSAQVIACTPEGLEMAQSHFPETAFDDVTYCTCGPFQAAFKAVLRGAPSVCFWIASSTREIVSVERNLKQLGVLLDFAPTLVMLYPSEARHRRRVEFDRNLIRIPYDSANPQAGFHCISELFPQEEADQAGQMRFSRPDENSRHHGQEGIEEWSAGRSASQTSSGQVQGT